MRDDNDYASMGRRELRQNLERVTKELAVWTEVAGNARRDENLYWIDGVRNSRGKSIAERRLDGDMHADEFTREALEAEGRAGYFAAIRDLLVILLKTAGVD